MGMTRRHGEARTGMIGKEIPGRRIGERSAGVTTTVASTMAAIDVNAVTTVSVVAITIGVVAMRIVIAIEKNGTVSAKAEAMHTHERIAARTTSRANHGPLIGAAAGELLQAAAGATGRQVGTRGGAAAARSSTAANGAAGNRVAGPGDQHGTQRRPGTQTWKWRALAAAVGAIGTASTTTAVPRSANQVAAARPRPTGGSTISGRRSKMHRP